MIKKILIGALIFLCILIGGIIAATIFGVLQSTLYISLMVLAALMIMASFFQIYFILKLIRTIIMVRDEMKPLIASVQDTVGIVKDTAKTAGRTVSTIGATTQLASEFALGPSVRTVAGLVAARQMFKVFFGKGQTLTRHEERRKQQMAAARGED